MNCGLAQNSVQKKIYLTELLELLKISRSTAFIQADVLIYNKYKAVIGLRKKTPTDTMSAMQRFRLPLSSLIVIGLSSFILSIASGQSSFNSEEGY